MYWPGVVPIPAEPASDPVAPKLKPVPAAGALQPRDRPVLVPLGAAVVPPEQGTIFWLNPRTDHSSEPY